MQHYDGNDDGDDVNGHVLTLETKVFLPVVGSGGLQLLIILVLIVNYHFNGVD